MSLLEKMILAGDDLRADERTAKHADWVEEWRDACELTEDNIHSVIQDEIGKVFVKVLECAGVYKCTKEGREAFGRFIDRLLQM